MIYENVDRSDAIRRAAADQGTGYVYLLDARTPDPRGRVPAQDIVGAVRVDGGAPVAGSFQHNPAHRLLTGSGWFRLPDDLEAALRDRLRGR